jgi:phosphopantothenoylcysteine decarboxylase / phosphopantothenate---cysteine ligase
MLKGKKVLIGISGSIAAYKIPFLVRLLKKSGAEVQIISTASALDFVTPLTLSTVSENQVFTDFKNNETGSWNNHVALALWADVMLIAPASMNTIAKMAQGICDNLLLATYFSAKCPVYLAPAMDLDMYAHPTNISNLQKIKSFGNFIIDSAVGELASGLEGKGRMEEPETIFNILNNHFSAKKPLKGKNILITAGPTIEQIDPVRFISNNSTGKMGYALAEKALEMGANVILISGQVNLPEPNSSIKLKKVKSALEMQKAVLKEAKSYHIAILTAAVADYAPKNIATSKIKKSGNDLTIELEKTPDIAFELGKIKKTNQKIIGFALETDNEQKNAAEKLKKKNFDMIVLNSLQDKGAGFGFDTNKISIIGKNNKTTHFELKSKKEVAQDILNYILKLK